MREQLHWEVLCARVAAQRAGNRAAGDVRRMWPSCSAWRPVEREYVDRGGEQELAGF